MMTLYFNWSIVSGDWEGEEALFIMVVDLHVTGVCFHKCLGGAIQGCYKDKPMKDFGAQD